MAALGAVLPKQGAHTTPTAATKPAASTSSTAASPASDATTCYMSGGTPVTIHGGTCADANASDSLAAAMAQPLAQPAAWHHAGYSTVAAGVELKWLTAKQIGSSDAGCYFTKCAEAYVYAQNGCSTLYVEGSCRTRRVTISA
jgi:hypothetical protein